jgi:NAD-dependent dihydropyrimidine dehydrogenase PreA subunit/bacterioferritin-associated ferredoxin
VRIVRRKAEVAEDRCSACATCVAICPVEAIRLEKHGGKRSAVIDEQECLDCTICVSRCPENAIRMIERESPLRVGVDMTDVPEREVARICRAAHMYPDQIICYCHRVQAKEIAAAILQGANTPEDIARATAARTGCGVLCITGVIRLLRAAGIELKKAPGCQWYGTKLSIWDLPAQLQERYPGYYLKEDLRAINELFPGGKK